MNVCMSVETNGEKSVEINVEANGKTSVETNAENTMDREDYNH